MNDKDRTKEQLINELVELRRRIPELEKSEAEYEEMKREVGKYRGHLEEVVSTRTYRLETLNNQLQQELVRCRQVEHYLNELVKELQCLYGINRIAARLELSIDEVLREVVYIMPQSWQYPEITSARITINGRVFKTANYKDSRWKQSSDIRMYGDKVGEVEVIYMEKRPEIDEGPFLKEERMLIDSVAEQLARIIESRQAEETLRQSEEKLRLTFESATEGIIVTDLEGKIMELNQSAVNLYGCDGKEELFGRNALELVAVSDRARVVEKFNEALEDNHVRDVEYMFLRRDGSEVPVQLSAAILRDTSGSPTGFMSINTDITERKKMQEQFIVTDRLASIGELASGIAHELNNPLTSIIGFSELLLDKDVPDDVKEDLRVINREAQRTSGVVRNLLTFARKHETESQPADINDAIQKVLELRAYEHRVNNIQVNAHFDADLPEIIANSFQLQQVFLNIIINAEHSMIKTHGGGTLTITTEQAGDVIRISLADDGSGITRENLGHLFDPFFTTKGVGEGTGLGLSICHGIVTEHGGRIYAESELGKGATFIVELPFSKS